MTSPAFAHWPPTLLEGLCASALPDEHGVNRFPAPYRQMSVAVDEASLLYALVRALKPLNVLELGTGLGLTARFIGEALQANGQDGLLITVEPLQELWGDAAALLEGLSVKVVAEYTFGSDWPHLVYIDSGLHYRHHDIKRWLQGDYLGLVLVHDAERAYPELQAGVGVYLPTANGMWLGRAK